MKLVLSLLSRIGTVRSKVLNRSICSCGLSVFELESDTVRFDILPAENMVIEEDGLIIMLCCSVMGRVSVACALKENVNALSVPLSERLGVMGT